jgi:hypothetical protein
VSCVQGFLGIKMDRAGLMKDAAKLSSMFNATGVRVLQENNDAKAHRDEAALAAGHTPTCWQWE